ncbi:alpha/beta hydrolase [Cohnella fermenti]|uniref:Alpha/beta hydrolase n=1 Tax=Cohnella fermenti TaxID=2565925 RepID=A0A4S4C827_9BACL|nr:alpha/beta hydrolase [Cohnella fermenti]THF84153.1 alpha/beta hydrolase [Cohnella fermenti]
MNIEMNRETVVVRPQMRVRRRLLPGLRFEEGLWRVAAGGIWIVSTAMAALSAPGAPTGFGTAFDVSAAILLNVAALLLSTLFVAWLLSWIRRAVPSLFVGASIYTIAALSILFAFGEISVPFAIGLACLLTGIGAGGGWLTGVLASRRFVWRTKLAAVIAVLFSAGVIALLTVDSRLFEANGEASLPPAELGEAILPLTAADPSLPGSYVYRSFTYGSGVDKHRAEFGAAAELVSESADASAYTSDWSWLRQRFWGFDESALPLNGRVWMPEGEGPWPLVLIVHGNHLMEDYSDEGYAYLGELLASRGFLAVSVDENFLNYSVWRGIPDEDMKLRAWLLLQHIGQLERFAADSSSAFYGAIDFDRIALIGHSRGGQAVAMAADPDVWFSEDKSLPDRESYRIGAVVAIAPTDTAVDGQNARLTDVAYMTLQGAEDGDVSNFYGERQYERSSFTSGSEAFKTSLYIGGANHGQFNTTWGARDEVNPVGLFLKKPELSGEEQRRMAKLYVSAFLETVFHGEDYKPLFADYRSGADILPETSYWNRYEDASFVPIARYENAEASDSRLDGGATAEAEGMESWRREEAVDRRGGGKGNSGVLLDWEEPNASYSIEADGVFRMPGMTGAADSSSASPALVFSLADLSWQLDDAAEEEDSDSGNGKSLAGVTVEIEDTEGRSASVLLDEIYAIQEPYRTSFTWLGWPEQSIGDGEYSSEVESAFQTYLLPLDLFESDDAEVNEDELVRIAFQFEGQSGRVLLDDIGFMAE